MTFRGFGLTGFGFGPQTNNTRLVTAAAGNPELFTDPNIQSANYSTSANVTRSSGLVTYAAATNLQALTLTSTLLSDFNAAIAANGGTGAIFDIALTYATGVSGNQRLRIWNGAVVLLTPAGAGVLTGLVTAGATSAAGLFLGGDTTPLTASFTKISVKLH